jgi:hypothetical protein
MTAGANAGLVNNRARGAAMEAHAGTIGIKVERRPKPKRRSFAQLRAALKRRRQQRARRAHALRANAPRAPFIPGSEHTHLLSRGRGF